MKKIYSKVEPHLVLHVIFQFWDFMGQPRKEILEADNFLQSSAIQADAETSFRAHMHINKKPKFDYEKAQECWVVMKGQIECSLYDVDKTLLGKYMVYQGGACYTLHGGHAFKVVKDDTCILEFKSTPYTGQANDKIFIDE